MAVVIGVACGSAPACAERRVALVIGNGAYVNAPQLPNPKNDAEDVAAALKRSGFDTIVGLDLDKAGMEDATIRFSRAARDADVAIFYYSGHAMQFAGVNYLMPVDARLTDESDLRRMARVDDIVADVQQAKNLRIMVLDSCRDNPLAEQLKRSIGSTRSGGATRGMAKIDSPQGMIVAYSTQAGRTAEDGQGRNSPYTGAFLKHIEAQEEIGTVFRRVSSDVYEGTKRAQLPELSLSLIGEFYLRGRPTFAAPAPLSTTEPKPSETPAVEAPTKQARLSEPADPFRRDLVTDCDRLAASPYDPKRANGVAGIQEKKIDIVPAMTACNDAMRQYPEVARFIFQAGRVSSAQKDHVTAYRLYTKATAMGNIPSMTNLGSAHNEGLGVAKDVSEARRWYEKAAAEGEPSAMANLGVLLQDRKDYMEARRWFEKAAALGDAQAMVSLGYMAENGLGTSKDLADARRLYEKAAIAGEPSAMANLGVLLQDRKDYMEARRWFEKAAALGDGPAMVSLGYMAENGQGTSKDLAEARRWYEKAAVAGEPVAMFNLGVLLQDRKDYKEARRWYEKAAAEGNADAMNNLSVIYADGLGVAKNQAESRRWLDKAAAGGSADAKAELKKLSKRR